MDELMSYSSLKWEYFLLSFTSDRKLKLFVLWSKMEFEDMVKNQDNNPQIHGKGSNWEFQAK